MCEKTPYQSTVFMMLTCRLGIHCDQYGKPR